ncbi:helix-turn-helix transcriptional regulator [Paenibacillus sp. FSL L8-0436]|uniref:helix-turn-helix domain-containing protein n=1 Tax=Paenibacillus sp. FSL L8-0436 TaxID=2954686 RepID=UPI0031597D27
MKLTPETIRVCRVNLGWTQGDLGKRSGISVPLLGAIERDERPLLPHVESNIRKAIPLTDEQITEIITIHRKINAGK